MNNLPNRKNRFAKFLAVIFCGLVLLSQPPRFSAYDNDTHFWLTYYLANKAGYTPLQATQIASANVSVDYDADTKPVFPSLNSWRDAFQLISHSQNVVYTFHALPSKNEVNTEARNRFKAEGKNEEVLDHWWDPTLEKKETIQNAANDIVQKTKKEFWRDTLEKRKNPGVFLHYAQDVYSHRKFKSWLGHGGYFYVDFLASNHSESQEMAFNTLKYLIVFRKHRSNADRNTNCYDAGYVDNLELADLVAAGDISADDIAEIKKVVSELGEQNPISPDTGEKIMDGEYKYVESDLVRKWRKFSPEKKNDHYRLPPLTFIPTLLKNKNRQPVPDSSRAMTFIRKKLNISDENSIYIWKYDLRNKTYEYVEDPETNRAYVYLPVKDNGNADLKKKHFSKDEEKNKKLEKICSSNKKYYLPFALVDKEKSLPSDIGSCNK